MNIQDEVRSNERMYHKYQGVCRTAGTHLKCCINSQESFVAFENKKHDQLGWCSTKLVPVNEQLWGIPRASIERFTGEINEMTE